MDVTENKFENHGVFNPGVIVHNGLIHLFYRATTKGNLSTIGHAILDNPTTVILREKEPFLIPTEPYESHGIEDPRIVKIDDIFYLTYTAYDGKSAFGALMTSTDLLHFERKGILTPYLTYKEFQLYMECCEDLNIKYLRFAKLFHRRVDPSLFSAMLLWDKDVCFFPRRINGKLVMLHRIYPDIQVVYFDRIEDLTYSFWKAYLIDIHDHILISSKYDFESSYVGAGCPPIETSEGWLIIYHGVEDTSQGYVYSVGAALFELDNPSKEIGRLKEPLFKPDLEWEKRGVTQFVVFPVGAIEEEKFLYIYYGAADKRIGVAKVETQEIINQIKKNQHEQP